MKLNVFVATLLAVAAFAPPTNAGDAAKTKQKKLDTQEKPALFIPFLGKPEFPTTTRPVVDNRLTLPIYQGLPDKPYRVTGDIYVPTRPNAAQAIDDAMRLAVSKGADALIVASDGEVHAQKIKGEGTLAPDINYFRAWAFKWTSHTAEILPDPKPGAVELTEPPQTVAHSTRARAKSKAEQNSALRRELVTNAKRIDWAQQGVIPAGYTQADYIHELRTEEAQILADLKELDEH